MQNFMFLSQTQTHQAEMETASVVLYPSAGIGHLVAMVELGKLILTQKPTLGVIVLITPAPYETGSTDKYITIVSATTPSITFHHLPTVALPPDFSSDFVDVAFGIAELYNPIFHETLVSISEKSTIKAVILDFFSNAAFQVAKSLNLPAYYFYTTSASSLCMFLQFPTIANTTPKSIEDLNFSLEIPGVPLLHVSDMSFASFDKESNSYTHIINTQFINTAINMAKSSGIIVNSFTGLEQRAVDTLRVGKCTPDGSTPPVYLIGPLIAGGNQVDPSENECLKWLNCQPSRSVVFLCFGSMGVFKKQQLKEIAIGLERSEQRFLWVVRNPPPEDENESNSGAKEFTLDDILPDGFLTRTSDKGLVVKNWAPQPAILSHDSVGGFVSHCGWNSVLEAAVAGIPMVAWPLYAEQKLNKVYLVQEMKVALGVKMSLDGFVVAEAVEETVRELMEGEQGRVVREQALEMSSRAKAAVDDEGSSRVDFSELIHAMI